MKNMITTKDLGALNELMTFENWMTIKLVDFSKTVSNSELKSFCSEMAKEHAANHEALLTYLKTNAPKGEN